MCTLNNNCIELDETKYERSNGAHQPRWIVDRLHTMRFFLPPPRPVPQCYSFSVFSTFYFWYPIWCHISVVNNVMNTLQYSNSTGVLYLTTVPCTSSFMVVHHELVTLFVYSKILLGYFYSRRYAMDVYIVRVHVVVKIRLVERPQAYGACWMCLYHGAGCGDSPPAPPVPYDCANRANILTMWYIL